MSEPHGLMLSTPVEPGDRLAHLMIPLREDVRLYRDLHGMVWTNIHRTVLAREENGFNYGDQSSFTEELALNILSAYVPPGSDDLPPVKARRGHASATAWRLYRPFMDQFLLTKHYKLTIPCAEILQFLSQHGCKQALQHPCRAVEAGVSENDGHETI
jgi:hypothetical protein